jgi:hypothetical protein
MSLKQRAQVARRLRKLESTFADRIWRVPRPSVDEAVARRLSASDREHLEEALARRCEPDLPQHLRDVLERWGVAFVEAQIECGWPIVFQAEEWFY